MAADEIQVRLTPSHPGDFIRTEVIEDLGLTVAESPAGSALGAQNRSNTNPGLAPGAVVC